MPDSAYIFDSEVQTVTRGSVAARPASDSSRPT